MKTIKEQLKKNLIKPFLPLGFSTLTLVILLYSLSQAAEAKHPASAAQTLQEKSSSISLDAQLGVPVCEQSHNRALNPSFEIDIQEPPDQPDDWQEDGSCTFSYSDPGPDSDVSARIVGASLDCKLRSPTYGVVVRADRLRHYDYSARIKTNLLAGQAFLRIRFLNEGGVTVRISDTVPVTDTQNAWVKTNGSVQVPNDAEYVRLETILAGPAQGSAWFDDVFMGLATCLDVSKSDDPDPVAPGGMLTYTIVYSNVGREKATKGEVIESYDNDVRFVWAYPSPVISPTTWDIPDVPPGGSGMITVVVQVKGDTRKSWLFNRVYVRSDETVGAVSTVITTAVTVSVNCKIDLDLPVVKKLGKPGYPTNYDDLALENTGACDGEANLAVTSSQSWTVTISPPPTYTLLSGDFREVMVSLNVPPDALSDTVDFAFITATLTCKPPCSETVIKTQTVTTTVGLAGSVVLTPGHPDGSASPDGQVVYTHALTNAVNFTQTVTLTADSSQGYSVTVTPITKELTPWNSSVVTVTVLVPSNAFSGTVDTTIVTATGTVTGQDTATDITAVRLAGDVTLTPNHPDGNALRGEQVVYTHTLTNDINFTQTITLTVSSSQGYPVTVTPTTTDELAPWDKSTVVTVTVFVPSDTPSDTEDTTVVTATGTITGQDTATNITVVEPRGVTLTPGHSGSASPGEQLVYTHTLTNNTNITQTMTLTASSSWGDTVTEVDPTTTESLAPWSGSRVVTVTVCCVPGDALSGTVYTTVLTATGMVTGQDTVTNVTTVGLVGHITLTPNHSGSTLPGKQIIYTHTLTNNVNFTQTVTLTASLSQGHTVTVTPTTTDELTPQDKSTVVTVTVLVSRNASAGTVYTTVITATGTVTGQDTATDVTTVLVPSPPSVTISGTTTGKINMTDTFTANVNASTAMLPINYTWSPTPTKGQGNPIATYTWYTVGAKIITVTATNDVGPGTDTHTIMVELHTVYLPLILRNWPPPPTLNPITPPNANTSYTVSWDTDYIAATYTLQEATNNTFSDAKTIYPNTATSYTITSRCIKQYYYRVMAYSNLGRSDWSNTESVQVRWECEPNNTLSSATGPIISDVSDLTYYGTFPGQGDMSDYFYFELDASRSIELWLTNIQNEHDYDLYLRRANGSVIEKSKKAGNANEHILPTNLSRGLYYIQVHNYGESGNTEPYHLQVIFKQ